jgi:hypothetical protein
MGDVHTWHTSTGLSRRKHGTPSGNTQVWLTDLSLSCGEAPSAEAASGTPLAATNEMSAGAIRKRRAAVKLGRKEGLQPRADERPAGSCSE